MAKQLIPVANKPILFYGLEDMAAAGIQDVIIVISPATGDEVQATVGDGSSFGLNIEYVVQPEPLGLAHALGVTLPKVGDDDILMYLGDNLVKEGVKDVVADFVEHRPEGQILLTPVDNPQAFGVAYLDENGEVTQLIEKPADPTSNLALVGVYLFDSTIREAVASISPSARGEYEITDAIQWLVDNGHQVRPSIVQHWWKDTGQKEDLLHANQLILSDITGSIDGELVNTKVHGAVHIERDAIVHDSELVGPVTIGPGAVVERSTVGPNVAIGPGCRVTDASLVNTITLADASVAGWQLRDSLIGRQAQLHGEGPGKPVEVALGERSEIKEL